MKLLNATLVYIISQIIDILLTLRGLPSGEEGNPFVLAWMHWLGTIPGMVIFKLLMAIAVVSGIILCQIASKKKGQPKTYTWVLYGGAILTFLCSTLWLI